MIHVANGPVVGSTYQEILHKNLIQLGVHHTQFHASTLLPLSKATRSGANVLHLDWLHPFYQSSNLSKAALKTIHLWLDSMLLADIPLVWNVHNLISHDTDQKSEDRNIRYLIDRIDTFVSFTQSGVSQICERWPIAKSRMISVIPHGNFVGIYPNFIDSHEAKSYFRIPRNSRVALSLGRIARYKGLDDLIHAYLNIAGQNDWLIIAGQPQNSSISNDLLRIASCHPRILFDFRKIPDSELQFFFNAANFCVYPFNRIFNSGSILLALSFRKLVVAPATPIFFEVAGHDAFIPIPSSPGGLEDVLKSAFSSEDLDLKGNVGYSRMVELNSWTDVAAKFKALYTSLL